MILQLLGDLAQTIMTGVGDVLGGFMDGVVESSLGRIDTYYDSAVTWLSNLFNR
ncbi:MAG: hypothetical protein LBM23_07620 [Propionibacteriaceae bacterium]|nr:hypothetical protein [Propionibacteriaceae bacterium]